MVPNGVRIPFSLLSRDEKSTDELWFSDPLFSIIKCVTARALACDCEWRSFDIHLPILFYKDEGTPPFCIASIHKNQLCDGDDDNNNKPSRRRFDCYYGPIDWLKETMPCVAYDQCDGLVLTPTACVFHDWPNWFRLQFRFAARCT